MSATVALGCRPVVAASGNTAGGVIGCVAASTSLRQLRRQAWPQTACSKRGLV